MSNYCDYEEQVSITTDDGSRERPDMVVRMPNERTIVVDAKTPMNAYITAMESDTDVEREDAIRLHAKQVRERAQDLSQKSYYRLFDRSPDFVVMFLPGEFLLQHALEQDHDLIDWAMQRNVVIATPNTLMALLKAVAMGWREAQIEEEAAKVAALGQELHDRIRIFAGHMVKMRSSINSTVENFNNGIGSLESRVLTSARRFKDMGIATSQEIPELTEIDSQTRDFRSAQLRALPEPNGVGDD
ncbi:DNA recombination protein RmuC homolog [Geodia barretti]|uniref:DNA recombination protein RmuC homolog n=1 Tax=Geodia barretti TaxID=519541 RepID=A0AA35W4U9_GEOBA|nr:DNA recombination protein RmuC homolog [Geodia barretti]